MKTIISVRELRGSEIFQLRLAIPNIAESFLCNINLLNLCEDSCTILFDLCVIKVAESFFLNIISCSDCE